MGGFIRRIGRALNTRPKTTATGIGTETVQSYDLENSSIDRPAIKEETRLKPITSTVKGAPLWLSAGADFLTSLGAGPEAAQRQQQMRAQHLQSLAQQALAPQQAKLQSLQMQHQMDQEQAKLTIAQKTLERSRWDHVVDPEKGTATFYDKDKLGTPGYKPVALNLRDFSPDGVQKTAESFR
mgnify:FL=1